MNTRLLNFLLIVQLIFAGSLIYIGVAVREKRRQDYLELTHRVTAGQAARKDFEKLIGFIPERAERSEIRSLFGLPLIRATGVEIVEAESKSYVPKGETWIYYFETQPINPENPPAPLDKNDVEKLSEKRDCFVVYFDDRGRATARIATVIHPLPALKP